MESIISLIIKLSSPYSFLVLIIAKPNYILSIILPNPTVMSMNRVNMKGMNLSAIIGVFLQKLVTLSCLAPNASMGLLNIDSFEGQ